MKAGRSLAAGVPSPRGPWALVLAALLVPVAGCDDNGMEPGSLRFGQLGQIQVRVITPLSLGAGEVQQVLTWSSNGAWELLETISLRGLVGDQNRLRPPGDPRAFGAAYASLITQLNETEGLRLFIEELDPDLEPDCGPARSRVNFEIRDDTREESVLWRRCGNGNLSSLTSTGAGPDPAASRVITAAALSRDFTVGESFQGTFDGSIPFGTLDRGETSGAALTGSQAFLAPEGSDAPPEEFVELWSVHTGGDTLPEVDWTEEMVLWAAVGERFEAGDSVEVRRVVTVGAITAGGGATNVEFLERIPGDFCSPAARTGRPFHIVVAPRTLAPVRFSQLPTERVPCGLP